MPNESIEEMLPQLLKQAETDLAQTAEKIAELIKRKKNLENLIKVLVKGAPHE